RVPPPEPGHPDEIAVRLEEGHAIALPARHAGIDQQGLEAPFLDAAPWHEAIAAPSGSDGEPRRKTVRIEGDGVGAARHEGAIGGMEAARRGRGADLGQGQRSRDHDLARLEIGQAAPPPAQPLAALLDAEPAGADQSPRDAGSEETTERALAGPAHRP